jgi:hypothetical protein
VKTGARYQNGLLCKGHSAAYPLPTKLSCYIFLQVAGSFPAFEFISLSALSGFLTRMLCVVFRQATSISYEQFLEFFVSASAVCRRTNTFNRQWFPLPCAPERIERPRKYDTAAFAKMRLHTDETLRHLETTTKVFGKQMRHFRDEICPRFETFELPGETEKRNRQNARQDTGAGSDFTASRSKKEGSKPSNLQIP